MERERTIRVGDREIEAALCPICPSWGVTLIAPPSALPDHLEQHAKCRALVLPVVKSRYRGGRIPGLLNRASSGLKKESIRHARGPVRNMRGD